MDTKLNNPHAERHLRQGFLRRLFQINSALEEVRRLTEAQGSEPLSHETSTLLDIYLGSYYINLSGALDNLAWMLAWEFQLTDTLSESDFSARRFCNLFREAFITALATKYPDLACYLADEPIRNWYSEIRNLRDPIAHRFPLLFVKGTLDEAEGIEYQKAYERRDEAIKRSTESFATGSITEANTFLETAMEETAYAESLGKFVPIVMTSNESGNRILSPNNQLLIDYSTFINISEATLNVFLD